MIATFVSDYFYVSATSTCSDLDYPSTTDTSGWFYSVEATSTTGGCTYHRREEHKKRCKRKNKRKGVVLDFPREESPKQNFQKMTDCFGTTEKPKTNVRVNRIRSSLK